MALTVTTDLTRITDAETATGWTSYGSGGTGAMALEPDFFAQNANCISRGSSGSAIKGMCFDIGSGSTINFTTGSHKDKLIYIWMRMTAPSLVDTLANGGIRVILGSGATAPADATGVWSAWYVDGSNTIVGTDGWICYVIDPQSTASTTYGGGCDLTAVRWFGGGAKYIAGAKGQTFGVDAIYYGRGELRVSGTVAATGEGFKEITALDFGTINNRYGVITERRGIYYVRGKIILGDNLGTGSLTFSSQNEVVVYETPHYHNGTNVVKAIPDASSGGTTGSDGATSYNGLAFVGNGTGSTSVTLGVIVGSDKGRSGSFVGSYNSPVLSTPARTRVTVVTDDSAGTLSLYGSTFSNLEGGIDLKGTGVDDDDCFSNTFNGCGRIVSNMEIRNCNILNSVAASDDGAHLWESTTNLQSCLFVNCSRAVVFESTTGTPFTFTSLTFSGNTKDVRNESGGSITINVSGGTYPLVSEDIGGGSATTINSSVPVTVTVVDKNNSPISTAQVSVYVGATEVINEDTDGSGVASGDWTGSVPSNAIYKVRKSSAGTRYVPVSGPAVIAAGTGMSVKVVLYIDSNV